MEATTAPHAVVVIHRYMKIYPTRVQFGERSGDRASQRSRLIILASSRYCNVTGTTWKLHDLMPLMPLRYYQSNLEYLNVPAGILHILISPPNHKASCKGRLKSKFQKNVFFHGDFWLLRLSWAHKQNLDSSERTTLFHW